MPWQFKQVIPIHQNMNTKYRIELHFKYQDLEYTEKLACATCKATLTKSQFLKIENANVECKNDSKDLIINQLCASNLRGEISAFRVVTVGDKYCTKRCAEMRFTKLTNLQLNRWVKR